MIWWRKIERRRMQELSTKYKHIQRLILETSTMNDLTKPKIVTSPNIDEMFMLSDNPNTIYISKDEREALDSWIRVLNGKNPNNLS